MKKTLSTLLVVAVLATSSASASNRGAGDDIFNEPKKSQGAQIVIGIVEFFAANSLMHQNLSNEEQALKQAEKQLEKAQNLFTSKDDKNESLDRLKKSWLRKAFSDDSHYDELSSSPVVTVADRNSAIKKAEENLAEARTKIIERAQKFGLLDRTFRVVKVGTSVVIFGDILGRVYVWNSMDADPTISPAATYFYHQFSK